MNKKNISITFIIVFILLLSLALRNMVKVQADTPVRKVGVAVDSTVRYGHYITTWSSNDPNAKPDEALVDVNRTEWKEVSVDNTTSTSLLFHETTHFINGTEDTAARYVDVDQGVGDGKLVFISAGLEKGDSIYSKGDALLLRINATISRTYMDVVRETNILNLTLPAVSEGQNVETTVCFLWDKATGILTESMSITVNKTGSYTTTWTKYERIIGTNLWETTDTEPPYLTIGVIVAVSFIIIGGLVLWSRKK